MSEDYNVVIDALQTKLNALEKMQKGCDNLNSSIGGGVGIMDCIRYEQMHELREAIKREKALSHVNETPKNEHDSADVLRPAKLVRLNDDALVNIYLECKAEWKATNKRQRQRIAVMFGNAIMEAMDRANK